jgi:hypothetical protein
MTVENERLTGAQGSVVSSGLLEESANTDSGSATGGIAWKCSAGEDCGKDDQKYASMSIPKDIFR